MRKNNVNIKARINRHLRILRENGNRNTRSKLNYSTIFVLFFIVFLFPIYPSLASVIYKNTEYEFYRGDIDESSIIDSYFAGDSLDDGEDAFLKDNIDSFVSVDTLVSGDRDTSGSNEIIKYTVKAGESFDSIANDFGITKNTILWANNFSPNKVIHPGDIIKLPPVSGLIYTVKKGDTIETIAKKYDIEVEKIKKQNKLSNESIIKIGESLILPGAKKIIPKPPAPAKQQYVARKNNGQKSSNYTPPANNTTNFPGTTEGYYQLVWRPTERNFAWGNCTYYVSHYKNVTWRGNANQWITNARAQGVPTGTIAKPGAIVQFGGRGYNMRYGHVGIVISVNRENNTMLVSDMNYRRLNEVTTRTVALNHRAIEGYIYVD